MLTRNFFELAPHTHTHEETHTLTHKTRLTFDLTPQATRGNAKYENNSNHKATTNRNIVEKKLSISISTNYQTFFVATQAAF